MLDRNVAFAFATLYFLVSLFLKIFSLKIYSLIYTLMKPSYNFEKKK